MILKEIQAVYKHSNANRPRVQSALDVVGMTDVIYPNGVNYVEEVKILALNNYGRVLGVSTISTGCITQAMADVRVIFQHLLLANATSFILIHNHPSGNCQPSKCDDELTNKVKQASQIMAIHLVDHVILTDDINNYYSYSDYGKL